MHTETVMLTPELAKQLLEKNVAHNRPLMWHRVKGMAEAFRRGEYVMSHQGIAIDTNDKLFDGQHRCHAVIESGVSIPIRITYGVPPEAFPITDVGLKRSPADVLRISQSTSSVALLLAKLMNSTKAGRQQPTPAQLMPYVALVEPVVTRLMDFCPKNSRAWASASVRAAAVVNILKGVPEEYVFLVYQALVFNNFDAMPKVAKHLVRQHMTGNVRGKSTDFYSRALKVFDPALANVDRLLLKGTESSIALTRQVLTERLSAGVSQEKLRQAAEKRPGTAKAANRAQPATV